MAALHAALVSLASPGQALSSDSHASTDGPASPDDDARTLPTPTLPSHRCVHDTLRGARATVSHQSYLMSTSSSDAPHAPVEGSLGDDSPQERAPPRDPGAEGVWKPLRLKILDNALYDDPGRTCFAVGQDYWDQGWRKSCGWADVLTAAKRDYLAKTLLPRAVEFFTQMLRVRPVQGGLRLHSLRCGFEGGVGVPGWLRDEGLAGADMVVFLTARPISMAETIAYAGHCETDQIGRPVAAHFNWSPGQLFVPQDEFAERYLVSVAMHELTHALVFSPDLIASFQSQPALTSLFTPSGTYASAVATPRVLRAARKHFGCDELPGAQLEDGGGSGTAASHWEMRWFRDEYMTGSASPGTRTFSAMTAALFADSGWYLVNSTFAEPMVWGHNLGCSFVNRPCDEWEQRGYRCGRTFQKGCSYDRRAKAYCDVRIFSAPLPYHMRHFADSTEGGYSALLDYCPVYRAYEDGHCQQGWARGSEYRSSGWEERCDSCRCFESSATDEPWGSGDGTTCHRMRCLNSTALEIRLGNRWRSCPSEGGALLLSPINDGRSGAVVCPPAHELCPVDGSLWPELFSLEPHSGSFKGGTIVTLTGRRLSTLKAPVQLTFGMQDGAEMPATDVQILNDTHVVATVPPYLAATSFARADLALTDAAGRAAYLFAAFVYEPSLQSYIITLGIVVVIMWLACVAAPRYIQGACDRQKHLFEWETGQEDGGEARNGLRGPIGERTKEMV